MAINITKPTVGGSEDTWGATINTALDTIVDGVNNNADGTTAIAPDLSTLTINGTDVTATAAELNIMDGVTASTAELNIMDGVTATTAELNTLDGVTATTAELNIMDGVTATTAEINKLDGFTGVADDLNYAKDLRATGVTAAEFDKLDGLTASAAELNIMDGVTATTSEINKLDGVTATTAEINHVDGVTSNIQTQLDGKVTTSRTISAGGGLTGGGSLSADRTISHADTSSQSSVNNSGNTVIQDVTLDGYGHVTGLTSATIPSYTQPTSTGGVGTYAWLGSPTSGPIASGTSYAGSGLKYAGSASTNTYNDDTAMHIGGSIPSGTWRAMGNVGITHRYAATLFLRIS